MHQGAYHGGTLPRVLLHLSCLLVTRPPSPVPLILFHYPFPSENQKPSESDGNTAKDVN